MTLAAGITEAIVAAGIPIFGVSISQNDDGEDKIRIDFQDEATKKQRKEAESIAQNFTPSPEPAWLQLIGSFTYPGNPLYAAILTNSLAAGTIAKDHFDNFKLGILSADVRSIGWLTAAVGHLDELLTEGKHPLDKDTKAAWDELIKECNLPPECGFNK